MTLSTRNDRRRSTKQRLIIQRENEDNHLLMRLDNPMIEAALRAYFKGASYGKNQRIAMRDALVAAQKVAADQMLEKVRATVAAE